MKIELSAKAVLRAMRYYARRGVYGRDSSATLQSLAAKTRQISRASELPVIRPYFREDHLARIIDSESFSAREIIEEHLKRTWVELYPVHVHEFRDAYLIDGSVFLANTIRLELRSVLDRGKGYRSFSALPALPQAEFSEAALVGGVAGSTWFGHWLEDEVPLQMLAQNYGRPIAHLRREYQHEPGYRELLDLEAPKRVGTARISRLTIVDEFAQNPSKARRYWRIREKIAAKRPKGSERVFLNRGATGSLRVLKNEAELIRRFESEGYAIVDVGKCSLDELLRKLVGASLVVSVEGSHLAHALYAMAQFGSMVILNPPDRTYTTVADIAPFCGLHASMYVGTSRGDGSFLIDISDLMTFIDQSITDRNSRLDEIERFVSSLSSFPTVE
jgi:hypothetical protein